MGPCLSVLLWTEALLRGLQRKTWPKATREEKKSYEENGVTQMLTMSCGLS